MARSGPCTRWRASCGSSLLEVDVDLPVIMQRLVLAVLYRITVEVPQLQFIVRCEQTAAKVVPVLGQGCVGPSVVRRCFRWWLQYIDKVVDVPVVLPTKAVEEFHFFPS